MTLAKNHVKREAFGQIGNRLDDLLDQIEKDKLKAEGAVTAVSGLSPKIQALHGHVDKDVDEGVITDLGVAKLIKTYITRAMDICSLSADAAERVKTKLSAKAEGITVSVFEVKKMFDQEDRAIQQAVALARIAEGGENEQILDSEPKEKRAVGESPRPSIKARRQAEELITASSKTEELEKAEPEKVVQIEEEDKPNPPTPQIDPLQEIQEAQQAAVRVDGRYQCGSCKRHFKSWDDLMEHCTLANHTPRSAE